jgi:Flp pilus assembly protein TadD
MARFPLFRVPTPMSVFRSLTLTALAAMALSGCAINRATPLHTPDYSNFTSAQTSAAVTDLSARYKRDPKDQQTMVSYAAALRAAGQADQAVAVMENGMLANKDNVDIKVNYAKALSAAGRYDQALNVIGDAIRPDAPDWNALLVKGAIQDQMGNNAGARDTYNQALLIAPTEPSLEGNLGLSYAMTNDLVQAETHLRRAASMPGANSKIRQNLALVIGMQGRFDEAKAIYAKELPPDQVDANMAYIKSMLSQQNRWASIKAAGATAQ